MDASRRPGTQTESRSRTILSPYDPVHAASNGPVPTIISHRHFMHRHQGDIDSTVSVVEALTAELYPGFQSRLPGPSSITNVGLSPVAHHPFVQLHPPTESWLLPGMASHPLLPVTFPHPNHRPSQASPLPNDSGPGRDHLSFISNPATVSVGAGATRQINPMPFSPTEPEHGNMEPERERNSLQADRSHPPIWARSYLAPSTPHVQVQGSGERQYDNNPQQPPTNMHASTQQSNIQLISPPNLDRRRQFMSQRSRRNMSSQTSAQASRVERQHSNRSLSGNAPTSRVRVDGHSRRVAPWSSRGGQAFYRATGGAETYMDAAFASTKPPPSKRALLSLEEVEISELPEDERTCIICYNDFGDECPEGHAETPRRLPKCKHVFGDRCIKKWLEESDNCPYCRDRVGRVRASDLTIADFAEMPREPSDDQPDELLDTFLQMGRAQLRHVPIYARVNMPRSPEERERHRVWLLQTREAQLRESTESPSRSPVQRMDVLVTPPPRAPSEMDPTIQTPTHSHFHREDMMATPPSTVPHLAAQQGHGAPTMPDQNSNIPRPGPMGGSGVGSFGTNSSTQTTSPSPESPHTNPLQNIPTLAEFTSASLLFDSHPDHGPTDGPFFLPSLGSGASRGRPGRGRRC